MEECGVLEIFGTAEDAQAIIKLAVAAEGDGLAVGWNERMTSDEIIEAILEAAREGEWLRIMKDECGDFEETRRACRAAGLSYIHSRGVSGGEGYETAAYWTPGQEREFQCGLIHGMAVGVPFEDLQKAAGEGYEAVKDLVAAYEELTLTHVGKSLRLSAEVVADLGVTAPTA